MAISWTPEKDRDLIELVEGAENVESGLRIVAELFGTSFFAVRNRWYSDTIKAKRKMTEREAKTFKPPVEPLAIAEEPVHVEETQVIQIEEQEPKAFVEHIDAFAISNKILEATRDFLNIVNNEVSVMRNKVVELQQDNADWIRRYGALENRYRVLEEDFAVLSRVINRARSLAAEESLGPKPAPRTFKQDVNGNLEVAAAQ